MVLDTWVLALALVLSLQLKLTSREEEDKKVTCVKSLGRKKAIGIRLVFPESGALIFNPHVASKKALDCY